MDFNVVDTEDTLNIDYERLRPIMDKIASDNAVSKQTVMSLESVMGANTIPVNIRNQITAVSSKHGMSDLLKFIKSVSKPELVTTARIIEMVIALAIDLRGREIRSIITDLQADRDELSKLYIPKLLKEVVGDDIKSVADMHVNMVISGTIASNTYSNVRSYTLRYLKHAESSVPFGKLLLLVNIIENDDWEVCTKGLTVAFDGSIRDYINTYIDLLERLIPLDMNDVITKINSRLVRAASEPGCEWLSSMSNVAARNIIRGDMYIPRR